MSNKSEGVPVASITEKLSVWMCLKPNASQAKLRIKHTFLLASDKLLCVITAKICTCYKQYKA